MSSLQDSLTSLVVLGAITFIFYFLMLKPLLGPHPPPRNDRRNDRQQRRRATAEDKSGMSNMKPVQCPAHVSEASAKIAMPGGRNLLSDGIVAFRHGTAATFEASNLSQEEIAANRKERAKVLARLLALDTRNSSGSSSATAAPPPRGSTIVVTIRPSELSQPTSENPIRRLLYLLGTNYALMLLIDTSTNNDDENLRKEIARPKNYGKSIFVNFSKYFLSIFRFFQQNQSLKT